jgi:hypothetical protein
MNVSRSRDRKAVVMLKARVITLSLLALAMVGSLTSVVALPASAAAHEFIVEGKGEGAKGLKSFIGTSGRNILWLSNTSFQRCMEDTTFLGFIISHKHCGAIEVFMGEAMLPTSCTVANEEVTEETVGELVGRGEYLETGAKIEETISESKVEGAKCEFAGTYKLKGKITCSIPEPELEKVIHELICTPAGSKTTMKVGEKAVEVPYFDTEYVKLESMKPWSSN